MSNEPVGGGSDPNLIGSPSPAAFEPPNLPSTPFPEPTAFPPGFIPGSDSLVSQPHFMQDGHWVSFDRMHWWNGAGRVLGRPPAPPASVPVGTGGSGPAVATIVGVIAFVVFAVVVLAMCQSTWINTPTVP